MEEMMAESHPPGWQVWAHFRFSIIGGLLSNPPESGELQSRLQELAEKNWQHPLRPGLMRVGFSTLERWYYQARNAADPVAALGRRIRRDCGKRQALSAALLKALDEQYQQHRRWSVQLHYDNLRALVAKQPELGPLPSYQSIRRCMQEHGWVRRREPARPTAGQRRAAERLEQREVRSFEASHVHALWHLDYHQARVKVLDTAGRWQTPMALAILDDRSRLCCHLQFYLTETAETLIHGLTQAFLKRGLPRALVTDNGAAMLAEETRQGLARLAIEHKATLPYSPYQNGKQEIFWAQLEGRLLELLRSVEPLTLAFLNQAAQAFVEQDYHRRIHRETGQSPLERFLAGPEVGRQAPDPDTLRQAFCRQVRRHQRRSDATVTVDAIRYEVPARFRHLPRLLLRYPGWDKSRLWLVDEHSGTLLSTLLPQDKQANSSGRRRTLAPEPVETSCSVPEPGMPALLSQWLADYAATGLPPAYLPKEEVDE